MRHVLLASVAAAAIALATAPQAAVAADLAVKAPPIVPVFSWTGVYIGGNLGVGWGRKNWSDPFPAPVFGDRIDIGGAIAGGQIGFNYQVGAAVWGLEADADWANIQGTNTCFAAIGGLNCGAKVKSIGTVAGRLGYAVDRTLLYVKGGGAWVNDEYSLNNSGVVIPPRRPDRDHHREQVGLDDRRRYRARAQQQLDDEARIQLRQLRLEHCDVPICRAVQ
jgi:opacity protein-like surface antigen